VANESTGNHKTLTKFFNLQRTRVSCLRNASRTLKLCQNISIWDIKRTIEWRHIFKFSGLIFLYILFLFLVLLKVWLCKWHSRYYRRTI